MFTYTTVSCIAFGILIIFVLLVLIPFIQSGRISGSNRSELDAEQIEILRSMKKKE